ncbi:MAG: DUF6531 domain-containing protein [Candidatus Thiodiazotropha sp.]
MKYLMFCILWIASASVLAEGGAYWDANIVRNPLHWFESADQLCRVVYDWKYPDGYGPYGDYPTEYTTYEYQGPEFTSDGTVACHTEVCRKYANYDDIICGTGTYVTGNRMYCPDQKIPDYNAETCFPNFHVTAPAPPTCSVPLEGDPVDPLTGNLILTEVDLTGEDGLVFTRYYHSMDLGQAGSHLGTNWTHSSASRIEKTNGLNVKYIKSRAFSSPAAACQYGWQDIYKKAFGGRLMYTSATYREGACQILSADGHVRATLNMIPDREVSRYVPYSYLSLIRPNGARYYFTKDASGVWSNLQGQAVQLTETDQTWTLTLSNGTREIYDTDGKLVSITQADGRQTSYTYNDEHELSQITYPNGKIMEFEYLDGRISRVSTPGGSVQYEYDAVGNISEVMYPDGTTKGYRYEDPAIPFLLTREIDENGVTLATWTYDSLGRVIVNERAGGTERYTFDYSTQGQTTVSDSSGATRTYHSDMINGRFVVNEISGDRCDTCSLGRDKKRTYDAKGQLSSRTDWNGSTTTYVRDENGLELSRTEAVGTPEERIITTEWHPSFHKPVRITEPKRIITNIYDNAGRLERKTEQSVE